MSRSFGSIPILAGALAASIFAASVRAEDSSTDGIVDVVIAARPEDAAELEEALREPVERQGVRLRWMRVEWFELSSVVVPDPTAPPAVARAWFDLVGISRRVGEAGEPEAVVYLVDGPWERVLVRNVSLAAGLDEVAREELAQVLASGVEGILAGASLGRPREEVRAELGVEASPPPLPADIEPVRPPLPPAEPTFAERFVFDLGLGYELEGFASGSVLTHGFGLELGLGERSGSVRFGGLLRGEYRLPLEVTGDAAGVRFDAGAVRVLATIELPLRPSFVLRAGLGGGFDVVRVEPRRTGDATAQLEPAGYEMGGILQAMLGAGLVLADGLRLWLGMGVDIDPAARRYVVDRGATRDVVFEPWLARPFGTVALTFDLLADGPH